MVDTNGLLLLVRVHAADIQDRHGGRELLDAALATPTGPVAPAAESPPEVGLPIGAVAASEDTIASTSVPEPVEVNPLPTGDAPSPMSSRPFPRLKKIWVDGAYHGVLEDHAHRTYGIDIEVVSRSDENALKMWVPPGGVPTPRAEKFKVIKRRWVVERTFGWFGRSRRLSKDYEQKPKVSEAWIYVSMNRLMLRRLGSSLPAVG